MKQKTPWILIVAATLIVGLVASASVGLACRNHGMGYGPGDATHLTTEQQQKLDAVREKYSDRLDKANSEAGMHARGHQGPWVSCNYNGCNHRNHRGDHS